MCVCTCVARICFYPHLYHSLKGQDALSLVYTMGSKPHVKRLGGAPSQGS